MDARLLFVQALSPLHAGTGQGVGVIDLPIAREKATQIPFLPGSTIKGVFRDACEDEEKCIRVFGPNTSRAEEHAGAVTFTDARLLLLPVRSLRGVFAWATSPLLLRRLSRDAKGMAGVPAGVPPVGNDESCLVAEQSSPLKIDTRNQVILEDLPLKPNFHAEAKAWADWIGQKLYPQDAQAQIDFSARFCVISDDALSFLLETATEVTARIRMEDQGKTVAQGQLWYEEALPTETVLVSMVVAGSVKSNPKEVFDTVTELSVDKTLQFGGKATVGRGLCKATLVEEDDHENIRSGIG